MSTLKRIVWGDRSWLALVVNDKPIEAISETLNGSGAAILHHRLGSSMENSNNPLGCRTICRAVTAPRNTSVEELERWRVKELLASSHHPVADLYVSMTGKSVEKTLLDGIIQNIPEL